MACFDLSGLIRSSVLRALANYPKTHVRYIRYKLLTKFTTFYFTKLGRSSYEFQYFAAVHFHNNSIRLVKLFGDGILGPKTRYMPN